MPGDLTSCRIFSARTGSNTRGIHHHDVGFDAVDFAFGDDALENDIRRRAPDFHFDAEPLLECCDQSPAVAVRHRGIKRQLAFLFRALLQPLIAVGALIAGNVGDGARLGVTGMARHGKQHGGHAEHDRQTPHTVLPPFNDHGNPRCGCHRKCIGVHFAMQATCRCRDYGLTFRTRVWCGRGPRIFFELRWQRR